MKDRDVPEWVRRSWGEEQKPITPEEADQMFKPSPNREAALVEAARAAHKEMQRVEDEIYPLDLDLAIAGLAAALKAYGEEK